MIKFSIVVPVYNEEESLIPLYEEIANSCQPLGVFEVIFVDDCSSDKTPALLQQCVAQNQDKVRVITLSERGGQTYAMRQGLDAALGEYVVTLDADLQNDPADIPRLYEKIQQGFDCVCGWRKARQDSFLKARLSKFGNVMQRLFTGLTIHDVSCTLRMYQKDCVSKIALNWEGQHRFIPLSLSLQGYKIAEIESHHRLRQFGVSKYSHKRIFRVIVDFFRLLMARGRK